MDENALAEQVSGDDEDGQSGAVDPGYETEQEAQEVGQEDQHNDDLPSSVKKRLGMQAKKHAREMRQLQQQLMQMQSQMQGGDSANPDYSNQHNNPYNSPGQPSAAPMNEEERIQKAVRMALGMKEHEERQAKEAEHANHIQKEYARLNDDFDRASEKYEDFEDVVRGDDVPFTKHVRDALLLVNNPADVAYKLGKNRDELERISKLHPLKQAQEVIKLGHSLMSGMAKKNAPNKSDPLGSIRVNPTGVGATTDKTPASTIRARMKAGTWK